MRRTLSDIATDVVTLKKCDVDLVARRVHEMVELLHRPHDTLTRNELARLAGIASTSVKTALDAGKNVWEILYPIPKEKKTTVRLTPDQIAKIKAAGIEI